MAGPSFVGPTGAQYGAQNMDSVQKGLDGIRQLGQFVEAQRQFNDQEKRLNRTLNATMQQKIFDNLIAATDGGSVQEVADQFGPALGGMFETWGLGPDQAAGLVETLKNTELSGPQALQWFMSISAKYGEGGTSADVMKTIESETTKFVKGGDAGGGAGGGAPAPRKAGASASSTTRKPNIFTATNTKMPPQASGQLSAVERLKQQLAQEWQDKKGSAAFIPVPVADQFYRGLTDEADKKLVEDWLASNEYKDFIDNGIKTFTSPSGQNANFSAGGKDYGLLPAGPVAAKNYDNIMSEVLRPGSTITPAAAGAGAGEGADPAAFRSWLVNEKGWNKEHPEGTSGFVNPNGTMDLTKVQGNEALVQEFMKSKGSATPESAVQNQNVSAATQSLGEQAISGAQAATRDLMSTLESIASGDISMTTKAKAQRAYSSIGLSFMPAALSAAKKDPQAVKKYLEYYKGLTQDPEAMLSIYAVTNPEAAAKLRDSLMTSDDPLSKMKYMAEYASAYAKLVEAGMKPAEIDLQMRKLELEYKKLGFEVTKEQANAAKAVNEVAAFALVPADQQNAMVNLVEAADKVRAAIVKERDAAQKKVLQQQLVKLTDTLNLASTRLSKYVSTVSGNEVKFSPVTIDTTTFEWKTGGALFWRKMAKATVPGTQEQGAAAAGKPSEAPKINPLEDELTRDYGG